MSEHRTTGQGTGTATSEGADVDAARAARIQDLRDVIGPNAEKFLQKYEQITPTMLERSRSESKKERRQAARQISKLLRGWSWPAFLVPFAWFFYRKMYGIGFMLIVLPIVVSLVFPNTSGAPALVLFILAAMSSKEFYHRRILAWIGEADERGLTGQARRELLQKAGGVSVPGAVLGSLILIAGLASNILYIASLSASQ